MLSDAFEQAQKLDALAKTTTLVDPKDGLPENVMTVFTIEDD